MAKNGKVRTGKLVEGEIVMDTIVEATVEQNNKEERVMVGQVIVLEDGKSFEVDGNVQKFDSKSKMFVELAKLGYSVGQIAKMTKSHYSFVYGVIDGKVGITRQESTSKSDVIRQMVDQGMTPGQIAKELNSNYSYVHSVVKKYKQQQEAAAI